MATSGKASAQRDRAPARTKRRSRGAIDQLPSGSYRVRVYAGEDPLTGERHDLVETAPTAAAAEKLRTKLLVQLDERRNPRSRHDAPFGGRRGQRPSPRTTMSRAPRPAAEGSPTRAACPVRHDTRTARTRCPRWS
jgi:hypothetical protein